MSVPLTKRQKEILDYVGCHIQRKGYAPTIQEIGARFGLSSPATVHKHLTNLQEKGLLARRWGRSRAMEIPSAARLRNAAPKLLLLCKAFVSCHQPPPATLMRRARAAISEIEGR